MIPPTPRRRSPNASFPRVSEDEPDYIDTLRIARKVFPAWVGMNRVSKGIGD